MRTYDVICIGAGHNGLTAAAYLARAGLRVLVLEQRPIVGGAAVTEAVFPGFRVSTLAYVISLFRPYIIQDLQLSRFGLCILPRNPSSFTPLPDGGYLLLGPEADLNAREIAKFSPRDAQRYPAYEATLEAIARLLEPWLDRAPPRFPLPAWQDLGFLTWWLRRSLGLRQHLTTMLRLLVGDADSWLDAWFENEVLKTTLGTDAVIGAWATPDMPGTAYVLLHHVMGTAGGARGVWGYVQGGMGGLTQALAAAARHHGAEIRTQARVSQILVRQGRVYGVALEDGTEFHARAVLSNATPAVTFLQLLAPDHLPEDFLDAVRAIPYPAGVAKVHLALKGVPSFRAWPAREPGPQHRGTIHIAPDRAYLRAAFAAALQGDIPEYPLLECTMPSAVDPTVAPEGRHLLQVFVQWVPYRPRQGPWSIQREMLLQRVLAVLAEYIENLWDILEDTHVVTPDVLEAEYGLTGGNIFHGAMTPDRLFFFRPVPGYADYRTPVQGLYLAGAGAHPGGGVLGAAGANAARALLQDWPRLSRPRGGHV